MQQGKDSSRPTDRIQDAIENIPSAEEIRQRLDDNAAEKKLLSRLLRIAVQRDQIKQEARNAS
jgi:hypothetical protein